MIVLMHKIVILNNNFKGTIIFNKDTIRTFL